MNKWSTSPGHPSEVHSTRLFRGSPAGLSPTCPQCNWLDIGLSSFPSTLCILILTFQGHPPKKSLHPSFWLSLCLWGTQTKTVLLLSYGKGRTGSTKEAGWSFSLSWACWRRVDPMEVDLSYSSKERVERSTSTVPKACQNQGAFLLYTKLYFSFSFCSSEKAA